MAASPSPGPRVVRFGVYEADLRTGELRKQGLRIRLPQQPFQVLAILLEHPGEMVAREELQKRLWPDGTFVDFEQGLNAAVKRLREALDDSAEAPRYIETLSRRGYRFIGTVNSAPCTALRQPEAPSATNEGVGPHARQRGFTIGLVAGAGVAAILTILLGLNLGGLRDRLLGRPVAGEITSIAVLPLENLSGDPEQEYFADGVTEALITELGKISPLQVISRQSVKRYKGTDKSVPEIAQELKVEAVVEGSVVREGDKVRVSAQLIQAAPERHLWAESYERDLRDVLALESSIASAIVNEVQARLTSQERAYLSAAHQVDPDAHDLYLKDRYSYNKGTIEFYMKSLEYFEQAIRRDPTYAAPHAGLSASYLILGHAVYLPPQEAFPKAKSAALKAIELDETLSETHSALADVSFLYDWNWAIAEKEYELAIQLNVSNANVHLAYSRFLTAMGRWDQALAEARLAQQIDPVSPYNGSAVGSTFYYVRQYERAVIELGKALDLDADNSGAHLYLGLACEQSGNLPKAIAELEQATSLSGNWPWTAFVGHAYAASGQPGKARRILAELNALSKQKYVSPWLFAVIYAGLGDKNQTMAWLEKSYQQREHDLVFSNVWPMFDPLRSDPRFQDLMQRIGLPPVRVLSGNPHEVWPQTELRVSGPSYSSRVLVSTSVSSFRSGRHPR